MKNSSWYVSIATQGVVGFSRAPGTVGTLMMMPIVYFIGRYELTLFWYSIFAFLCIICGAYVVYRALPAFNNTDASAIIIDEMAAVPMIFFGIVISYWVLSIGFLLFRFFDIVKPFGIARIERIPGVCGVMGDDLAAALLSNVILHVIGIMVG